MANSDTKPPTQVEISLSCRNLRNRDQTSLSDPVVVFLQMNADTEQYVEIDRTERVKNNLNPDFARKMEVDYHFEEKQLLQFDVYDVDKDTDDLNSHDFLGRYRCSLGELVSRRKIESELLGTSGKGRIIVSVIELTPCKGSITLQLFGDHLDKKDVFGKSDPYLEIHRANEIPAGPETEFTLVHRTEVVAKNLNPRWAPVTFTLATLCLGDKNRTIKFDCYDHDDNGKHDFIGSCSMLASQLLYGSEGSFELTRVKKNKEKSSGVIRVQTVSVEMEHSFLDYISGGTQLNFSLAVDFTASNGEPHKKFSLHHISNDTDPPLNQYEAAIRAIGEIIEDYDSDRQFPALGFGARVPPNEKASHCFPLTFDNSNPYCGGVSGLLEAYRNAVRSVEFYAPTNFEPVIRHTMQLAKCHQDGSHYFVLLIITDGAISDLKATIQAIIDASVLPMSIIIVGVGNEDFSSMDFLDSDSQPLAQDGQVADRDIVQFVPFRRFEKAPGEFDRAALAQCVLAELPSQVVDWMTRHQKKVQWLS